MKVVYVAGPFRCPSAFVEGHQNAWGIQQNVMAALALSLEVWRRGAAAICPHANTMFFQNAALDNVWLEGDLAILSKCDAMLMSENWRQSSGARAEHDYAVKHGILILYTLGELDIWLGRTSP